MKKTGTSIKSPKMLAPSPELIEVQALMPIDASDRERLMRDIQKTMEIRDPIKVYQGKDNKWMILGGYNRWQIAIELNMTTVPVDVYEGTEKEKLELVINDNLNRRHFTAEQKRDLIRYFLRTDPEKSNKSIAKKTGTTKETVKKQRDEMVSGGEIRPLETARGDDGKIYRKTEKVLAQQKQIKEKPSVKIDDKQIVKDAVGDIKFSIKSSLSSVPKQHRKTVVKELITYLKSLD
jgi:ParB-like chromosome segregation protein Spo0J